MQDPQSNPEASPNPDVFATMRAEHAAVVERLEALVSSADRIASRHSPADEGHVRAFAEHLQSQFATHMRSEDEVLYPALESTLPSTRQSLTPLRGEHDELRSMLASLRVTLDEPTSPTRNEQIAVQAQDLADLLRIHIRKEEAVVFAVAERLMRPEELSALAVRLARAASPSTSTSPRASKG